MKKREEAGLSRAFRADPISRRDFVTSLGAFFTAQLILPPILRGAGLPKGLTPLRLGFLTDCHAMAELDAPAWLDRTAALMNSLEPDLIIGGGDFVNGGFYSPGGVMEQRWSIADGFLKKLRTRLEPVIGNHDFFEPLLPDGSPSRIDPRWRFRKQFGLERTYRSFEFKGYRFLILDSVKVVGGASPYRGWISANQLLWLDRELKKIPSNQPIILCSHIPFRTSLADHLGPIEGPSPGRARVLNSKAVMEKLRGRPLVAILQGHVHLDERLMLDDVPCITGGAVCGKWWQGPNNGTFPGLGLIEILPGTSSPSGQKPPVASVGWDYRNTPASSAHGNA
jgi:3',5'-cyclic AMP phosphodiesterase CpdA